MPSQFRFRRATTFLKVGSMTSPDATGSVPPSAGRVRHGPPVYVRRQAVHDVHVVAALAERGAVVVGEVDAVPSGTPVVFSAHGLSPEVHRQAAPDATTLAVDETEDVVATLTARLANARGPSGGDMCHAAANRHTERLIDGPAELREEWFAGVTSVGVTAGASAPPAPVDDIAAALRGLGPATDRVAAVEDVHVSPPAIGEPR